MTWKCRKRRKLRKWWKPIKLSKNATRKSYFLPNHHLLRTWKTPERRSSSATQKLNLDFLYEDESDNKAFPKGAPTSEVEVAKTEAATNLSST